MDVSLPPVETPLPAIDVHQPSGRGPPREPCLSSDYGSEANDAFPNALALDAATAPSRGNYVREASRRIVGLIRGSKSSPSPAGGASLPREDTQQVKDATSGKQDAERVAVIPSRPTPPRSSVHGSRPQERVSIARKLTTFLGFDGARTSGAKSSDVPEDAAAPLVYWKPHEKILKMLGYRPRGYGQPFTNKYTLGEVLGMGGFGVVREGTHKPDGEVLAVKVISRDAVKDMDALAQEVDTLRRLDHHQVVRFIDFYEEPQTFFLVLEKVPGGELFDRIVAEGKFTEESARACMRSLLEALAYCHSQKIAHRDIKPENILFASLDAKDRTVKLTDFGLARSVERGLIAGTPCGTPSYMAPESIRLMPHGTQVDCWGVGVVTHILLCGFLPFNSSRTEKLFRLIKKGRVSFEDACWRSVSQNAMDFVLALLRVDPDTRLTTEQALQHPWLTDAVEEAEEGGQELGAAMTKLRTFNAKRKLRVAIRTLIAFRQLEGSASSMEVGVARPPLLALQAAKERRTTPRGIGRKSTGIFSDRKWGKNVHLNRESTLRPLRPTGLLVAEGLGEELSSVAAQRIASEEVAEDSESDAMSNDKE
ncbi:unnamed protein product [Ectocarpus sp. 6 AP-2014]